MAFLDISEVLTDPMFTSEVTLVSKSQTYDEYGNPVWGADSRKIIQAVVTSDLKTIERLADGLRKAGTILVRFPAEFAPDDFKGGGFDSVIYRDRTYVVTDCADYVQFGRGFYRLTCTDEAINDGKN